MTNSTATLLVATGKAGSLSRCVVLAIVGLGAVAVSPVLVSHGLPGWGLCLFGAGAVVLIGLGVYTLRRTACPQCEFGAVAKAPNPHAIELFTLPSRIPVSSGDAEIGTS